MPAPSTDTLTAIGRMTLAAAHLERLLAQIGAPPALDLDEPGAALAAARRAMRQYPSPARDDLINAVEGTAAQLATAQAMLRRVLTGESQAGPAFFDRMTTQLIRCRAWLVAVLEDASTAQHPEMTCSAR